MKKRISGVDVNGWRDVAARDWDPDESESTTEETVVLEGGTGSVAVKQTSKTWVGGPQAALAPHGRGGGWGNQIGSTDLRIDLANVCEDFTLDPANCHDDALRAAVDALSRAAEDVVVAVPDIPAFGEAAQGKVLDLFRGQRRSHRLLWRPVAAFLHALKMGDISANAESCVFRILIHVGSGLEVQTLRLRRDAEHLEHLAPERDGFGSTTFGQLGLRNLAERAQQIVISKNPVLAEGSCERSRLGLNLLCGVAEPSDREILRHNNGNWLEVKAPDIAPEDLFSNLDATDLAEIKSAEGIAATFLLTPLADPFKAALTKLLAPNVPNFRLLEWEAIASGCLIAGRIIDRGLPHYFDRLTPIGLAVMDARTGEPQFEDLIGTNVTLPANREYVSPPFQSLEWQQGKREIEFYILKGDAEVRHWQVSQEVLPSRNVKVELRLRQTPGQSWARLSLTSPDWEPLQRAQISLDWATLTPVDATPSEVLEKLRTPPPPIPLRIAESAHAVLWNGNEKFQGVLAALKGVDRRGRIVPKQIASAVSRPWRDPVSGIRYWAVGTDGILPKGISTENLKLFANALRQCEAEVLSATPLIPLSDNEALKCLTWVFTLCPETIQNVIVDALEADSFGRKHFLLGGAMGRITVLTQGAGRVVTGPDRLRRLLNVFASRDQNANTLNALSMILSRRQEAPKALTLELVEKIAVHLANELVALTEKLSFQIRFRNALSALAGLFRYREVDRYALLANRDSTAKKLLVNVEKVEALLACSRVQVKNFEAKMKILASIREYLNGGGDPDILILIDNLEDD